MSMNNNSNQQNLCKQGCGFYGNAQNMDMCSKCYQNFLKTSNREETPHSQSPSQSPYGSQISINDIYQSRAKIGESNNRKRVAQSEIESVHKVPKTCKNEDSEQYVAPMAPVTGTNQIMDMFSTPLATAASANAVGNARSPASGIDEQQDHPGDQEASPANSQHSTGHSTKKPRRCEFCRRKVGLTGFDCRCGGHFCGTHRYSDKHGCTFDYQAHGQEQIKHQNPMICGTKIKKI